MSAEGWWFVAFGTPAPQGSKSFKGMTPAGKPILAESSEAVKPWRQDVAAAAIAARVQGAKCLDGPLCVTMVFTLKRPIGAPKRLVAPSTQPDLDKLIRATCDAIGTAGLWADDARVARINAGKVWAGYSIDALASPGVRVACVPLHQPDGSNTTVIHDALLAASRHAHPPAALVDARFRRTA